MNIGYNIYPHGHKQEEPVRIQLSVAADTRPAIRPGTGLDKRRDDCLPIENYCGMDSGNIMRYS
jgi:hypothetical protein